MLRNITVLGLLVLLMACQGEVTPSLASDKQVSGFDFTELDSSVSPGDDFFAYAYGKELAAVEIPADQ